MQANVEQAHPAEDEKKPFSWTKQWYPIAAVKDLDPKRPHAEMLLGEHYCTKEERVWDNCTYVAISGQIIYKFVGTCLGALASGVRGKGAESRGLK